MCKSSIGIVESPSISIMYILGQKWKKKILGTLSRIFGKQTKNIFWKIYNSIAGKKYILTI